MSVYLNTKKITTKALRTQSYTKFKPLVLLSALSALVVALL